MFMGARSKKWFREEFGFPENLIPKNAIFEDPDSFFKVVEGEGGNSMLKSLKNEQQWSIGVLSTPMLAELRERNAAKLEMAAANGSPSMTFKVIEGDVIGLHGELNNAHATFQVASQFNCLEMPSDSYTPEAGITGYINDRTQGPACVLCTGPALVFRNYLHTPRGVQIDNLDRLGEELGNEGGCYWTMRNGYTLSSSEKLADLNQKMDSFANRDDLLSLLKIGVHADIAVTKKEEDGKVVEAMQVTHVLGSACAVSYNIKTSTDDWEKFARLVLDASYEACFLAALENLERHPNAPGAKKLFLTNLGGGAFGNEQNWILDAIKRAVTMFKYHGLEVILVCYGDVTAGPRQLEQELQTELSE